MFKCDQCGREFKTGRGLSVHMLQHMPKGEEAPVVPLDETRNLMPEPTRRLTDEEILLALNELRQGLTESLQAMKFLVESQQQFFANQHIITAEEVEEARQKVEAAKLQVGQQLQSKRDAIKNAPRVRIISSFDIVMTVNGYSVGIQAGIPQEVPEPIANAYFDLVRTRASADRQAALIASMSETTRESDEVGGSYARLAQIVQAQQEA